MINQITYKELKDWEQQAQPFMLIDVREAFEHQAFNIGGKLLPFSEFSVADYQFDSADPVVIYCAKGVRSMIVLQRLSERIDCSNFYNLTGGVATLT